MTLNRHYRLNGFYFILGGLVKCNVTVRLLYILFAVDYDTLHFVLNYSIFATCMQTIKMFIKFKSK